MVQASAHRPYAETLAADIRAQEVRIERLQRAADALQAAGSQVEKTERMVREAAAELQAESRVMMVDAASMGLSTALSSLSTLSKATSVQRSLVQRLLGPPESPLERGLEQMSLAVRAASTGLVMPAMTPPASRGDPGEGFERAASAALAATGFVREPGVRLAWQGLVAFTVVGSRAVVRLTGQKDIQPEKDLQAAQDSLEGLRELYTYLASSTQAGMEQAIKSDALRTFLGTVAIKGVTRVNAYCVAAQLLVSGVCLRRGHALWTKADDLAHSQTSLEARRAALLKDISTRLTILQQDRDELRRLQRIDATPAPPLPALPAQYDWIYSHLVRDHRRLPARSLPTPWAALAALPEPSGGLTRDGKALIEQRELEELKRQRAAAKAERRRLANEAWRERQRRMAECDVGTYSGSNLDLEAARQRINGVTSNWEFD